MIKWLMMKNLWPAVDGPEDDADWSVDLPENPTVTEPIPTLLVPVVDIKPNIAVVIERPKTPSDLKIDPETREDVKFIRSQISRFRENALSCFSINNEMKANAIERALNNALQKGVVDVRIDAQVKDALAIHRIFSFFGFKATKASTELDESLSQFPAIK